MHLIKRARPCPLSRYTQPSLTATSPFPPPHQPHDSHIHSLASIRKHPHCSSAFPPPNPRRPPTHPGHPPPFRAFATKPAPADQEPPPPTPYTYQTLAPLTTSPSPHRLIIDVREPAELDDTGRIPSAVSMPITSNPDAFHLDSEEFFERFGFERPVAREQRDDGGEEGERAAGIGGGANNPYTKEMKGREAQAGLNGGDVEVGEGHARGGGVEEVIFYCKAGVRSRAAARMAREWKGVKVGDMKGGWMEWSASGGEVER